MAIQCGRFTPWSTANRVPDGALSRSPRCLTLNRRVGDYLGFPPPEQLSQNGRRRLAMSSSELLHENCGSMVMDHRVRQAWPDATWRGSTSGWTARISNVERLNGGRPDKAPRRNSSLRSCECGARGARSTCNRTGRGSACAESPGAQREFSCPVLTAASAAFSPALAPDRMVIMS